jgi:hypothetical protein
MTKYLISFLLLSILLTAQNKKHILLKNAVAHIGNGDVIENSLVSIKDGKIDLVADARLIRIDISKYILNLQNVYKIQEITSNDCNRRDL